MSNILLKSSHTSNKSQPTLKRSSNIIREIITKKEKKKCMIGLA